MGLLDWAPKGFTLVSRGRLHGMQFGAKLLGLFEGIGSRLVSQSLLQVCFYHLELGTDLGLRASYLEIRLWAKWRFNCRPKY